jgi:hypothetical protein
MYKYEGFEVGQRIKAYDFQPIPGRDEHFIEGTIIGVCLAGENTAVPYAHYLVVCDHDSDYDESYSRLDELIYVPMETSMDYDGRVTLKDATKIFTKELEAEAAGPFPGNF